MHTKIVSLVFLFAASIAIVLALNNSQPSSISQTAAVSGAGSGLIAHFTFDDDSDSAIADSLGAHDASIVGTVSKTSGRIGDGALSFNGSGGHAVGNSAIVSSYPFSISAWVRLDSTDSAGIIFSLGISDKQVGYYGIGASAGQAQMIFRPDSGSSNTSLSGGSLSAGQWHHVTGVFASDTDKRLYVDGQPAGTSAASKEFNNGVDRFMMGRNARLGQSCSGGLGCLDGDIDDVRVYGRSLSGGEVAELFALGSGSVPDEVQSPSQVQEAPQESSHQTVYSLFIAKSGSGSGTVTGGQISCGSTCSWEGVTAGSQVALSASPSQGSVFEGWSGGCSGTGSCAITVSSNTTVTATFSQQAPHRKATMSVKADGSGDHQTIQACLDVAEAGDMCVVGPGTYDETLEFPRSGTANKLIRLRAEYPFDRNNPSRRSVVTGGITMSPYTAVQGMEFVNRGVSIDGSGVEVIGNYIHGSGDTPVPTAISFIRTRGPSPYHSNILVKDNYLYQMGYGMLIHCSANCLIEGNDLERLYAKTSCRPEGACPGDSDYVRIFGNGITFRGNRIHGSKLEEIDGDAHVDGIQSFNNGGLGGQGRDTLTNIVIEDNYVADSHQTIWWTSTNSLYKGEPMLNDNVTIRNNIFLNTWGTPARMSIGGANSDNIYVYNNLFGQSVRIVARNKAVIKNNMFFSNFMNTSNDRFTWPQLSFEISNNAIGYGGWLNSGIEKYPDLAAANILDPDWTEVFVNYEARDYRTKAGSPTIDKGVDLSSTGFTKDREGISRNQGSGWDIGPYEYKDASTQAPSSYTPSQSVSQPEQTTSAQDADADDSPDSLSVASYASAEAPSVAVPSRAVFSATESSTPLSFRRLIDLLIAIGAINPDKAAIARSYADNLTAAPPLAASPLPRTLYRGAWGEDVRTLQRLLNQKGYTIAAYGPGSPGSETDFFGPSTEAAVRRYQCATLSICSGTPQTTGYGLVGVRTRGELAK